MVIATQKIYGQRGGEQPFEITIEIGQPHSATDYPDEWLCTYAVDGLKTRPSKLRSGDAMHALCLALMIIRTELRDFQAEGGGLSYDPKGEQAFDIATAFCLPEKFKT